MNRQTYFESEATADFSIKALRPDLGIGPALTVLLLLLTAFSLYTLTPPAVVPASAPASDFSAARAMTQLQTIAARPHPIGSAEHAVVRDYLLQQLSAAGLQPTVQQATGINQDVRGPVRAGTVENVLARLPGTANSRALLIVGHYDSVPTGNGASDDGAAVAAMLETVRALRASAPLRNDLIFLFSDGEEAGLLGAQAFVKNHPWAKDVGLVLNFEARGSSGPSIMFETSNGNGWLIDQFAAAAPNPVGNSLAYEVYRLLPNDTDMSVFKRAGFAGLNFAYIDNPSRYHTQLDNLEQIDQRSLQHHGTNLLALARRFGNLDLTRTRTANAVYFNLLGTQLVRYSSHWILPLSLLITLLFAGLFAYGLRKKELSLKGFLLGALAFVASLIVGPLLVTLLWKLIFLLQGRGGAPLGEAYHSTLYLIGFVALTIALVSAFYVLFRRRAGRLDLMAGGMFIWLLLLLVSSFLLPGVTYLFTWPLFFSLLAWGYMIRMRTRANSERKIWLVFALCAIPAVVLLAPTIQQVFVGLTLSLLAPVIILLVLLLGLLLPYLEVMGGQRQWRMPIVATLFSIMFIMVGLFASDAQATAPKQDQIIYGLNADTGQAAWLTFDRAPDEWTAQYLTRRPEYAPLTDFFALNTAGRFPRAAAPVVALAAPQVTLLGESTHEGARVLRLHLASTRGAAALSVYLDSNAEVIHAQINGAETDSQLPFTIERRYNWAMQYRALPPEGIDLTLESKATEPLKLRVVDQSAGLPPMPSSTFKARPAHIIPSSNPYSDSTLVSKSFIF